VARIRSVKPEFFLSESMGAVPFAARLLFVGLWTLADREGRLLWSDKRIKAQVFPYDDGLDVRPLAEALVECGSLVFYPADGGRLVAWLPTFTAHQRPHPKEPMSVLPACPDTCPDVSGRWLPWKDTASREKPGCIPSSPVGREGKVHLGSGNDDDPAPAARSSSSFAPKLVTSALDYDKQRRSFSFMGQRLKVPHKLHAECRDKLGGSDPDLALAEWYALLDADLQASGEPVPDVFDWLRPQFKAWCAGLATRSSMVSVADAHAATAEYHREMQAAREASEARRRARAGGAA
jgi:hypothetical protein